MLVLLMFSWLVALSSSSIEKTCESSKECQSMLNLRNEYGAVVSGATGAIGRYVVSHLVDSPQCTTVVALSRKDIPREQYSTSFPNLNQELAEQKLTIKVVDYDHLDEKDLYLKDSSTKEPKMKALFCCLGTTRKDAGSAEAFRKVDLEYISNLAQLAKSSSFHYFGLVSAMNSNKDSWFLYPQVKGFAEEVVKEQNFSRTSIFKPGLLRRGDKTRFIEKLAAYVVTNVEAEAVAKSMVRDFENGSDGLKIIEHAEIKSFEN